MKWGRYGVNPHYHILLDVPNTQKQTYEALDQAIKDPKMIKAGSSVDPSPKNCVARLLN